MPVLTSILIGAASFIVVLSLVVFVHEFGHFQVAKWLKVKIEKFSMGFGPELAAWVDKNGVRWRIGAYPLGGYVKFVGDEDLSSFAPSKTEHDEKDNGLFHSKPVWVRALVTLAGPAFNFIFAIFVFAILFVSFGEHYQKPIIGQILPNSTAEQIGLQKGDLILSVNGRQMESDRDLQRAIMTAGGQNLMLKVQRQSTVMDFAATPQIVERETPFGDKEQQGALGIMLGVDKKDRVHKSYNPISATARAAAQTYQVVELQVKFIGALFRGGVSAGHLNGPLGIGQTAGMVAKNSIEGAGDGANFGEKAGSLALGLVQLSAVLSIAIGFANLLPLPILDGGHLVFYAIEAARGKPVAPKVQEVSFKIGMACLLALFIFATIQDLDRVGLFQSIKAISKSG